MPHRAPSIISPFSRHFRQPVKLPPPASDHSGNRPHVHDPASRCHTPEEFADRLQRTAIAVAALRGPGKAPSRYRPTESPPAPFARPGRIHRRGSISFDSAISAQIGSTIAVSGAWTPIYGRFSLCAGAIGGCGASASRVGQTQHPVDLSQQHRTTGERGLHEAAFAYFPRFLEAADSMKNGEIVCEPDDRPQKAKPSASAGGFFAVF